MNDQRESSLLITGFIFHVYIPSKKFLSGVPSKKILSGTPSKKFYDHSKKIYSVVKKILLGLI